MARIGILATPYAVERNMEHILYRIPKILSKENHIDIIGLEAESERIRGSFHIIRANAVERAVGNVPFIGPFFKRIFILRRYIRSFHPDIVMALSSVGVNGFCTSLIGKKMSIPTVIRVTSDIFNVHKFTYPFNKRVKLFFSNNLLGRLAILLSTKTIVLHEIQAKQLERAGFSITKFHVISQPIIFPPEKDLSSLSINLRDTFNIPHNAFLVGVIGRLDPDKRLDMMVRVVQLVLKHDSNAFFMIVGNGSRKKWLRQKLSNGRVIFVDQIPRDQLANFYKSINVLLHTSYSEGLSSVIAEAIYFGVPVVASDSGEITRALVSNVRKTADGLAELILSRRITKDPLPPYLIPEHTSRKYLELVRGLEKNFSQ